MSTSKGALKATKAALGAHKYEEAVKEARKVIEIDPKNYHALVVMSLNIPSERLTSYVLKKCVSWPCTRQVGTE